MYIFTCFSQSLIITISERCEKKLMSLKQDELGGWLKNMNRFLRYVLYHPQDRYHFYATDVMVDNL